MPRNEIKINNFKDMVIANKSKINFDKTTKCEFEVEDLENC